MPAWKVLFIMTFGLACLALALATVVVPTTTAAADYKWLWGTGLLAATVGLGTLFTMFLRHADRTFTLSRSRYAQR